MYLGATAALLGAAFYWTSVSLLVYALGCAACCHAFVIAFEEPHLRRTFGQPYEAYCMDVNSLAAALARAEPRLGRSGSDIHLRAAP
jgi:protein-S-isoprenylcysteine O-methyltransferase Ste14